jgi:hypothetical protein
VTTVVHVDDLIITSPSAQLVRPTNKAIEDKYIQLKVNEGHTHNYLGMVLDFAEASNVDVNLTVMIEETTRSPGIEAIEQEVCYALSPHTIPV